MMMQRDEHYRHPAIIFIFILYVSTKYSWAVDRYQYHSSPEWNGQAKVPIDTQPRTTLAVSCQAQLVCAPKVSD